jgi:hypothetical protein
MAENKNSEEKVLSLLTQIRWDVVHGQDHWPSAAVAHPLIEGIHSFGAQAKPYIPWVSAELFVLLIERLPLTILSSSTLRSSSHHVISAASLGFKKIRLKRPVTSRYRITKTGILLCFALLPNGVSSGG